MLNSLKKPALILLMAFCLLAGSLRIIQAFESEQVHKDELHYQIQALPVAGFADSSYPLTALNRYIVEPTSEYTLQLSVAEYMNNQGDTKHALVFPDPGQIPMMTASQETLRYKVWQEVSEIIRQHTDKEDMFLTWWDNGQRLELMADRTAWVSQPVAALYPENAERKFWHEISGGFSQQSDKIIQLSEWYMQDAEQAIKTISEQFPTEKTYFLASIDDLARVGEIAALTEKKPAIESRVFQQRDNIHQLIARVKLWAKEKGTGSYLLQSLPGKGVRAWRILDEQTENLLLIRLLPFTHSLEKPLLHLKLVFQSSKAQYLSIYNLAPIVDQVADFSK